MVRNHLHHNWFWLNSEIKSCKALCTDDIVHSRLRMNTMDDSRAEQYHPAHKSVVAMAAVHDCGFELIDHPP